MNKICIGLLSLLMLGCMSVEKKKIEIHGHRGCRGIYPENTIAGFLYAIDMGVTAIEMDVVLTADSQVLVSHEPFMSGVIMLQANGKSIAVEDAPNWNIYHMRLDEVQQFRAGEKAHPKFPKQKLSPAHKPTLIEVVNAVKQHCEAHQLKMPVFNIEVKSRKEWVGKYQVPQDAYAEIIVRTIQRLTIWKNTILQSFDVELLKALHGLNPNAQLGFIVDNENSPEQNLAELDFVPYAYNPAFNLVDTKTVVWAHSHNMKIIPWTVNTSTKMEDLVKMGVDGIITDYPNVAMVLAKKLGCEVVHE